MKSTQINRLVAEIVNQMNLEGQSIGVDQYLQIQDLLGRLPTETSEQEIKELLVPILATSPQEQQHLYNLFEQVSARFERIDNAVVIEQQPKRFTVWLILVFIAFGLLFFLSGFLVDSLVFNYWSNPSYSIGLLTLFGASIFLLRQVKNTRWRIFLSSIYIIAAIFGNTLKNFVLNKATDRLYVKVFDESLQAGDTIQRNISIPPGTFPDRFTFDSSGIQSGIFQAIDSLQFQFIGLSQTEANQADTVIIQLYQGSHLIDKLTYTFTIYAPAKIQANEIELPRATKVAQLQPLPYPYYHDFNSLHIDPDLLARADFYERFEVWIKLLIISFITFFFMSILRWRQSEEQQLIAELESHNNPPFVWNIQIPNIKDVALEQDLKLSLNQLRQRTTDERTAIDIKNTVKKTAQNAGQISLIYRQLTKAGEYLLLIDRSNIDDHRSRLFDTIFQYFQKEEVEMERFFYDGDPRLCFNEEHPKGINIGELQQKYGDARLIIIGSAHRMLHPFTGKLSKWTSIFTAWNKRAILSPRPVSDWKRKERHLSSTFQLMPASIKGLETALDQFEAKDPLPWEDAVARVTDAMVEPIRFEGNILDTLECHYSPKMIQWIAACAIYPSLHWDLTLYLGQQLSTEETNLLSLSNLMSLNRLPWFVEGKIPDQVRLPLLELIPEDQEQELRKKLYDIFLENPPPQANSVAFDEYKMQLILNEMLLSDHPQRKEELEKEYAQYLAAGYPTDFAVLKYLEREASPLDFYVPDELKDLAKARREKKKWKNTFKISLWDIAKELAAFLCIIVGASFVVGVIAYFVDQYVNGDLAQEFQEASFLMSMAFFILVPFMLWVIWFWLVLKPVQFLRKSKLASRFRKYFPNPYGNILEKNNMAILRWMIPLWIAMISITILLDPKIKACTGELVHYQEDSTEPIKEKVILNASALCLNMPKDHLIYQERLALDAIQLNELNVVDSINRNFRSFSSLDPDSIAFLNAFKTERSALIRQQHIRLSNDELLDQFIIDTLFEYVDTSSLISFVTGSNALENMDRLSEYYQTYPVKEYTANLAVENYNIGITYYNEYVVQLTENIGDDPNSFDQMEQNISGNISEQNIQQQLPVEQPISSEELLKYNLHRAIGYFFLSYLYDTQNPFIRDALFMTLSKQPKQAEFINLMASIVDESGAPIADAELRTNFGTTTFSDEDGFATLEIPTSLRDSSILITVSKDSRNTKYAKMLFRFIPNEVEGDVEIQLKKEDTPKEEILIFRNKAGNEGLRDANGKIIVPANYTKIDQDPISGLFRVQQKSKIGLQMGYIDQKGEIVIPIRYNKLGFIRDGLILAEDQLFGYLDSKGRVVIDFQYEFARDFNKGLAQVSSRVNGRSYSYSINRNGQCQSNCPPVYGTIRDDVSGAIYQTVKIGNQVWLAENLKVKTIDSWCYDDDPKNCEKFGRLYTWDAAIRACPRGWRLPSINDWLVLIENSNNILPFDVSMAGVRNTDGKYDYLNLQSHIWTATDQNSREGSALFLIFKNALPSKNKKAQTKDVIIDEEGEVLFDNTSISVRTSEAGYKSDGLSCRCIQDFTKK